MANPAARPPEVKPKSAHFSSGPCAKRPGCTAELLKHALLGRSHRSQEGRARLVEAVELRRKLRRITADYTIRLLPAVDTAAVSVALGSLPARHDGPRRARANVG